MKTSEILQSVLAVGKYLESNPQKPITNADRIRSMTDEELGYFISENAWDIAPCQEQYIEEFEDGTKGCTQQNCIGCWIAWLKQGVVET